MKILTAALLSLVISSAVFGKDPVLVKGDVPYPREARVQGVEGTVVLEALVDAQGRVFGADVVSPAHVLLDQAAVDAVTAWTFDPAEEGGQAVWKVVRIPVRFELVPAGAVAPRGTLARN